jgi:hypothetical protein
MRGLLTLICLVVCADGAVILSGKATINGIARFEVSTNSVVVDAWQTFSGGVSGQALSSAQMDSGMTGTGSWGYGSSGNNTEWFVTNVTSVSFKTPRSIGASRLTETGTNWMQVNHGAGSAAGDDLIYFAPVPYGGYEELGTNDNMIVSFFILFNATNTIAPTARNLDHVHMVGNPYSVMQQQITGDNEIKSHGEGLLGPPITITAGTLYWVSAMRDRIAGKSRVKIWNQSDWSLVGSSDADMAEGWSSWYCMFRTHYLEGSVGEVIGYTRIGGLTISHSNAYTTNGIPDP